MNSSHLVLCLALALGAINSSAQSLDDKVKGLFEKRCAECHSDTVKEPEDPPLSQKTNLAELRSNAKYVVAGDAQKSSLIEKVTLPAGDKHRMPQSRGAEGDKKYRPPLTSDELALLKQWVEGGPPATGGAERKFIDENAILNIVQANLNSSPAGSGEARYLTLTNWYNATDVKGNPLIDDKTLDLYRAGLNKMINSLSLTKEIVKLQPVDPNKIVLRLNLSDYGWDSERWESIVKFYPFGLVADTAISKEIASKTGSSRSVVRGDWFVFVTSQPPLYHKLLGIPGDNQSDAAFELERKLGLDLASALKAEDAVRSGFEKSGVSQGNRVLERVSTSAGGYYWKSYDFDRNRKNEVGGDIFRSPLGPVSVGLTPTAALQFAHAGSEVVYSLPNGLQAYLLADSQGNRLDEAPINIVRDSSRADGKIINGISCIGCHKNGMFGATPKDEVLAHALASNRSPEDEAQIKRLYSQAKMDAVLEADTKKFNAALAKCGVDEAGDEPVRALYYRFMADLPPSVLAAEMGGLGDDSTAILAILQKHPSREVNEITGKFEAGQPVPRSIFLQVFPKLVADLGMPGVQVFAELAVTEFGGKVIDDNLNGGNKNGGGIRRLDAKQETVRVIDLNIGGAGGGKAVGMTLQGQQPASASDAATTKGGVIRINLADGTSSSDPGPAPAIRNATGTDGQDGGQKVFKLALPKNGDGYDQSQISAAAQESQHHGR